MPAAKLRDSGGLLRLPPSSSSIRRRASWTGGRHTVSDDCLYCASQLRGRGNDGVYVPLNNATGSVRDQLKTLDRIDAEIGGDLARLIILQDVEKWRGFPVVKEVNGYKIE